MIFLASVASQLLYFIALRFYDPVLGDKSPGYATYKRLLDKSNELQDRYVKPAWEYRRMKQSRKTFITCAVNKRPDSQHER